MTNIGAPVGQIGNYEVLRLLGAGGMGSVYEGRHVHIGKRAAIKVLHAHLARNPQIVARFLNEARAVSLVQHNGLVSIFEWGQLPDGVPFLMMEFLEGESLAAWFHRNGAGPRPQVLRLVRQVADALIAVHDRGIVHRDLKPDNVMIIQDLEVPGGQRAKLLDFGIAKITALLHGGAQQLTGTSAQLGTPSYMAPEQCAGSTRETDGKSDVYSLGVTLYQLLSGQLPFDAPGLGALMLAHINEEPRALDLLAPTVPPPLCDLVHRMLAKQPASRPTMGEVVAALDSLLHGSLLHGALPATVVAAVPVPQAPSMATPAFAVGTAPVRPRPHLPWASALAAVALIATVGVFAWSTRHSAPEAVASLRAVESTVPAVASATPAVASATPAVAPVPTLAASPAPPVAPVRTSLLASENGGHIVLASSSSWEKPMNGGWAGMDIGEWAVFAFKDDHPATFDRFTVFIPETTSTNVNEIELSQGNELLAGNQLPTRDFLPITKCHARNLKDYRTPHQECSFPAVTARYLKVRVASTHGENRAYVHEIQLFGVVQETAPPTGPAVPPAPAAPPALPAPPPSSVPPAPPPATTPAPIPTLAADRLPDAGRRIAVMAPSCGGIEGVFAGKLRKAGYAVVEGAADLQLRAACRTTWLPLPQELAASGQISGQASITASVVRIADRAQLAQAEAHKAASGVPGVAQGEALSRAASVVAEQVVAQLKGARP